jgi:hypothetical protein
MSKWWRIVLLGGLAIICFDALAAVASQRFGFAYSKASIGSDIIYACIGFLATEGTASITRGILAAAMVGVLDATIGWWVSWLIGPGRIPTGPPSALELLAAVAVVAILGATAGAIGGLANKWQNRVRGVAS